MPAWLPTKKLLIPIVEVFPASGEEEKRLVAPVWYQRFVPVATAPQVGAPAPLESKAYPDVPAGVEVMLVAPEKYNIPPWVPVANPVPPLLVANVPPKTNVPEVVIGPPVKVNPVELPLASTLVTVPEVVVAQDKAPEP